MAGDLLGELIVVSGPAGAGKGTILKAAMAKLPSLRYSVSATTREPRPGEVDGVDYFFVDEKTFEARVAEGGFLEHAYVHGHYYGTPKAHVEALLEAGQDVVLEIDVQGALQIKEKTGLGTYIFIAPPSMAVLKQRLKDRGTETDEQFALRVANARAEIAEAAKYDYVVFNDALAQAVEDFVSIVRATHLTPSAQATQLAGIFDDNDGDHQTA